MALYPLIDGFDRNHLGTRNLQDDRGVILDLTRFAGRGGLDVDFQGQWYKKGSGVPSGTLVPGTVDLPGWATEKECLDWNYTPDPRKCEDWESTSEMRERVAKRFFRQAAKFADGRWQSIPGYEWAGAIR